MESWVHHLGKSSSTIDPKGDPTWGHCDLMKKQYTIKGDVYYFGEQDSKEVTSGNDLDLRRINADIRRLNESSSNKRGILPPGNKALASRASIPQIYLSWVFDNVLARVLIDTGASVNIINRKTINNTSCRWWPVTYDDIMIRSFMGTSLANEWILIELYFGGFRQLVPCLVSEKLHFDLLLGMPWLNQVRAIIDIHRRIVSTDVGTFAWTNDRGLPEKGDCHLVSRHEEDSSTQGDDKEENEEALTDGQLSAINAACTPTMLSEVAVKRVRNLFRIYRKVWIKPRYHGAKGIYHEFTLTDNRPVVLPPRGIPQGALPTLTEEINRMLQDKVVEISSSPYCTYPVMVHKKDGTWKVAVDYRKLNEVTVVDKTPLPRIEDLIASTEGSKYFGLLDLRGGFWHIKLRRSQRHLTAFRTHMGLYQFRVMPYGLVNAPATFQRWMNDLFGDLRHQGVLTYIDDILIHSPTEEGFLALLEIVMSRLHFYGAYLKIEKCEIGRSKFDYLGHQFENGVRRPQENKVKVLRHLKTPQDVRGVQSLLGMINFYRHYIPHCSDLCKPLTLLLKKGVKFKWGPEQENAKTKIVDKLAEAVLRVSPTGTKFRLETDASEVGLGAVLYSKEEFDSSFSPLPILFLAKTLTLTEQNWSAQEREAYAIVWALEACDGFVRGREVEIHCDHRNLIWMQSKKTGKIARWVSRLTEYNITIHYIEGKRNMVADFLSRYVEDDPLEKDNMFCYLVETRKRMYMPRGETLLGIPKRPRPMDTSSDHMSQDDELVVLIEEDENQPILEEDDNPHNPIVVDTKCPGGERHSETHITNISKIQELMDSEPTVAPTEHMVSTDPRSYLWENPTRHTKERDEDDDPLLVRSIREPTVQEIISLQAQEPPTEWNRSFSRAGGYIYYLSRVWVPLSLRAKLVDAVHLLPPYFHPRARKMYTLLGRLYNWEGMWSFLTSYVKACYVCQLVQSRKIMPNITLRKHPVQDPFEYVYADLWGPITWKGKPFTLLTVIDNHTKWAKAIPLKNKSSEVISSALFTHWISEYGPPKVLISDNEPSFTSGVFNGFLKKFNIEHWTALSYHPQGNSPVERFHRTLKESLIKLAHVELGNMDFQEALSWTLLHYRSVPHSSIGDSPAFIAFGKDITILNHPSHNPQEMPTSSNSLEFSRLTMLGILRQSIKQRSMIEIDRLKKNEHLSRSTRLWPNDLVVFKLNPTELTHRSQLMESSKIISEWSYPARVIATNHDGTRAEVKLLTTGDTRRVALSDCVLLEAPPEGSVLEFYNKSVLTVSSHEARSVPNIGNEGDEINREEEN